MSPTTPRTAAYRPIAYLVHLLTTLAWYSTWSSIVSDLHNHTTNASRRPQRAMQTVLFKRPLTTYLLCSFQLLCWNCLYCLMHVLFCFPFCWCPCMAINVSVQYDGGFLPDIILLTQCYYHRGTRLNAMKRFCIFSYSSHLNVLTFFPPDWGMLRRSRCIQIFL